MKLLALLFTIYIASKCVLADYQVGVGIADITGPSVEITFMGYANMEQKGEGIHLRQFSRAFLFENSGSRLVYVSIDAGMMNTGLRKRVLELLKEKFGSTYNENNVILSGTHTHSGPGGYNMHMLFDITILGFAVQTFEAHATGIVKSIEIAHNSLTPAKIYYNEGIINSANINRSPSSYLLNPQSERAKYNGDTDKKIAQIKFVSVTNGTLLGALNWFAVHATSMNNTNHLVSSDNVGYASVLLEEAVNPKGTFPGKGKIVTAFASTNLGDVSPNIMGPKCQHTGVDCDILSSRCVNFDDKCFASGPGRNMYESTKIIAERIMRGGMELLQIDGGHEITGPIRAVHQFVNMTNIEVPDYDVESERFIENRRVGGCVPAMGYSFAAGTTDGPGAFNFSQGTTSGNPIWDSIRDLLAVPTEEDIKCQAPKPILLATGRVKYPYKWSPEIVSSQLALLGDLVIAAVPGEFTTMSGRRMRSLLTNTFAAAGKDVKVVIAGLSNTYSDYIATPEEYQAQRYEAASTIYGPHTLTIHLYKFNEMAKAIIANETVEPGPTPVDFSDKLISLITPVIFDVAPWGLEIGDCVLQPESTYTNGDFVHVKFISGNPRNNLMTEKTYLAVEKYDENENSWVVIATDSHWETRFVWERTSLLLGTSRANIFWEINSSTPIGTYRIKHYGYFRYVLGATRLYEGVSNTFRVY
ncbi:neutral ceramidase-like isoform X2 [Arctopsyche grandis]